MDKIEVTIPEYIKLLKFQLDLDDSVHRLHYANKFSKIPCELCEIDCFIKYPPFARDSDTDFLGYLLNECWTYKVISYDEIEYFKMLNNEVVDFNNRASQIFKKYNYEFDDSGTFYSYTIEFPKFMKTLDIQFNYRYLPCFDDFINNLTKVEIDFNEEMRIELAYLAEAMED